MRKHELLFVTIKDKKTKYVPRKREVWTYFEFTHWDKNWSSNDHYYSPDKDQFIHCYDDLEIGRNYVILSSLKDLPADKLGEQEFHRWVWTGALEFEPKQMKKIIAYHKKVGDIKKTCEYAEDVKYPKFIVDGEPLISWD